MRASVGLLSIWRVNAACAHRELVFATYNGCARKTATVPVGQARRVHPCALLAVHQHSRQARRLSLGWASLAMRLWLVCLKPFFKDYKDKAFSQEVRLLAGAL